MSMNKKGGGDLAALVASLSREVARTKTPVTEVVKLDGDTGFRHEGDEIILPANPTPMSLSDAINVLQRKDNELSTTINISEIIRGVHFTDGLVAMNKAFRSVFGWAESVSIPTFFGPIHPTSIDVPVGLNKSVRVLHGRFEVPNIDGHFESSVAVEDGIPCLRIVGETTKQYQPMFEKFAEETRRIAAQESIYRGKAFELKFKNGKVSPDAPEFINIMGAETPIFSQHVQAAVRANILNPIEYAARCREMKIPLKRGVLLEGPYGTGKTLVSRQTGQTAVANGWTFILVRDACNVAEAIKFARRFQPAVVFAEDIDREFNGEERTAQIDNILNTLDGVDSKNAEMMVVLTSNHAEQLNPAMIRPGRLDAIISVTPPDAEAVVRLLHHYGRDLIDPAADYSEVGQELEGSAAAVIREVIERAKLYALSSSTGGEQFILSPEDLLSSAITMRRQMDLLAGRKPEVVHPAVAFFEKLVEQVLEGTGEIAENTVPDSVDTRLTRIMKAVGA